MYIYTYTNLYIYKSGEHEKEFRFYRNRNPNPLCVRVQGVKRWTLFEVNPICVYIHIYIYIEREREREGERARRGGGRGECSYPMGSLPYSSTLILCACTGRQALDSFQVNSIYTYIPICMYIYIYRERGGGGGGSTRGDHFFYSSRCVYRASSAGPFSRPNPPRRSVRVSSTGTTLRLGPRRAL